MQPKIPQLKSRYIPVHNISYAADSIYLNVHWWKTSSPFYYPNVLINLLTCDKSQIDEAKKNSDNLFLLTDSGGFQVISGKCNLTWKDSLMKQIEFGASKIFAFDKPPVRPKFEGSLNQFIYMNENETKEIINKNLDVALLQSNFLKENYPDEFKKFCYILHGKNLEQINYNLTLFQEKFGGIDKYSEYFPGGIVYAAKSPDLLMITIAARHAYDNFIKRGIYVHFLGLGSFKRMLMLIRNEITTFDSSSTLQGARANEFTNPINSLGGMQLLTENFIFKKQFCTCPVCSELDYNELIKQNVPIGRFFIGHNLWHLLIINTFLDALPKDKYTQLVMENFKMGDEVKVCLDFCDDCDKMGFSIAYEKYKHHLKKDETKQNTLF